MWQRIKLLRYPGRVTSSMASIHPFPISISLSEVMYYAHTLIYRPGWWFRTATISSNSTERPSGTRLTRVLRGEINASINHVRSLPAETHTELDHNQERNCSFRWRVDVGHAPESDRFRYMLEAPTEDKQLSIPGTVWMDPSGFQPSNSIYSSLVCIVLW